MQNPTRTRILSHIVTDGECWTWTAAKVGSGYGALRVDGKVQSAHRVSYEAHVGPIPEGLVLDHLCRNRACVNPAHLEPVTHGENIRRGECPTAVTIRTKQCQRGHAMTPENTYIRPSGRGAHQCRECRRLGRKTHRV